MKENNINVIWRELIVEEISKLEKIEQKKRRELGILIS